MLYFSFLKYSQIVAEAPRMDPVIVAIAALLLAFSKLSSNGTSQPVLQVLFRIYLYWVPSTRLYEVGGSLVEPAHSATRNFW